MNHKCVFCHMMFIFLAVVDGAASFEKQYEGSYMVYNTGNEWLSIKF